VIKNILHKGLLLYYEEGQGSRLPSEQLAKISRFLTALDAISSIEDIKVLGNGIHALKGELKGYWALNVTGNYRLVFRFVPPDVCDVDYLDYH
jgi:proteic killer suppression protein